VCVLERGAGIASAFCCFTFLDNCAGPAMTPMRAKHCLAWIVIRQRQLAGRRKAATLRTAAKVFAQIACEH